MKSTRSGSNGNSGGGYKSFSSHCRYCNQPWLLLLITGVTTFAFTARPLHLPLPLHLHLPSTRNKSCKDIISRNRNSKSVSDKINDPSLGTKTLTVTALNAVKKSKGREESNSDDAGDLGVPMPFPGNGKEDVNVDVDDPTSTTIITSVSAGRKRKLTDTSKTTKSKSKSKSKIKSKIKSIKSKSQSTLSSETERKAKTKTYKPKDLNMKTFNKIQNNYDELFVFQAAVEKFVFSLPNDTDRNKMVRLVGLATVQLETLRKLKLFAATKPIGYSYTLTTEAFQAIENNPVKLSSFRNNIEKCLASLDATKPEDLNEVGRLRELLGYVKRQLVVLEKKKERKSGKDEPRVAEIEYKIAESEFKFRRDLIAFSKRIGQLFEWFQAENKRKYMAPYFPMVQSSGMGKTKLLHEYKKEHSLTTRLVLCSRMTGARAEKQLPSKKRLVYSNTLNVRDDLDLEDQRKNIVFQLDALVNSVTKQEQQLGQLDGASDTITTTTTTNTDKERPVVLLFDEAQNLLESDGFAFRCVRWWLCRNREPHERKVVAVFTGTTSKLSNFFGEDDETNLSRDSKKNYNDAKGLYEPFYEICTIGLFKNKNLDEVSGVNDLIRAAKYGRPLFASLAAEGKLTDETLGAIQGRIILGGSNKYKLNDEACFNVLGARLVMGQVPFEVASKLVSRGYANLAHFYSIGNAKGASICFHPDPVCAYAAMDVMTLPIDDEEREPLCWGRIASNLVISGLCRPDKGDLGEIAAALYLLQSGDVLRKVIDPHLKHFAVPLSKWMSRMAAPNEPWPEKMSLATDHDEPCVSFIQVCRNSLQHNIEDLVEGPFLKEWFEAGLAFYAHRGCWGYDIIAPVRYVTGEEGKKETKYCPMLISVKNWVTYKNGEAEANLETLKEMLNNTTAGVGIAVLINTGVMDPSKHNREQNRIVYNLTFEKIDFNKQGGNIRSYEITVPEDDCFGVWNLAFNTTAAGGDRVGIYDSQLVVHQSIHLSKAQQENLTSAGASPAAKELFTSLIEGYQTT